MKTKMHYLPVLLILFCSLTVTTQAQFLNKLKNKAEKAVTKPSEKTTDNTGPQETGTAATSPAATQTAGTTPETKSSGESDFIPGSTVLYFDNFEKEKNGDSPAGWMTTSSAEVVSIDGQKGKWLKMASLNANHITRNKKQSWSNAFTVEFDLLIVKKDYDPRIDFTLLNTGGRLVTDEMILRNAKNMVYVSTILGDDGKKARESLS